MLRSYFILVFVYRATTEHETLELMEGLLVFRFFASDGPSLYN